MELFQFIGLVFLGVFLGIISVTVGGAGLFSTPLLLLLGLSPYSAIATTKFSLLSSVITGSRRYFKGKTLENKKEVGLYALVSFIGAIIGANITLTIDESLLKILIILFAVGVIFISIFKNNWGTIEKKVKLNFKGTFYSILALFLVSIYSGSIGIGAGTFMIFVFILLLGKNYLQSSALMSLVNIATLGGASIVFAYKGVIDYQIGLPLLIGSLAGGWIGAHFAVIKGSNFIRIIFLIISTLTILKLISDLLL